MQSDGTLTHTNQDGTSIGFFSVLPVSHLGQMHVVLPAPAERGQPLHNADLLVAMHRIHRHDDHSISVSTNLCFGNTPCILSGLPGDMTKLRKEFLAWPKSSANLCYRMPGLPSHLNGVVQCLFDNKAFDPRLGRTVPELADQLFLDHEEAVSFLQSLLHLGIVWRASQDQGQGVDTDAADVLEDRWCLTAHTVQTVCFSHPLENPQTVCSGRGERPLTDSTVYELMLRLQDDGWTWRNSGGRPEKSLPAYRMVEPATPKEWSSTTSMKRNPQSMKPYLLCLLQSESLAQNGVVDIAHGQTQEYYNALLEGRPPAAAAKADRKRRRETLALESDVGVSSGVADEAGDAAAPGIPAEAAAAAEADDESFEAELQVALEEALMGPPPPPASPPRLLDGGGGAPPTHPAAIAASASGGALPTAGVEAEPELPARPVAGLAHAEKAEEDSVYDINIDLLRLAKPFFVFKFSSKRAGTQLLAHGGLEANCPFHRKGSRTGCKKFMRCNGPSAEARQATLTRLKWWCAQAAQYRFQWQHVAFTPSLEDCPGLDVIVAMCPKEKPAVLRDDAELAATAGRPP